MGVSVVDMGKLKRVSVGHLMAIRIKV